MEKISQLMDGELGPHESRLQIRRLEQEGELAEAWGTYHLIRDVLRDEAGFGAGVAQHVCERLRHEPGVAPYSRFVPRVVLHSLPLAAAVAGVAIVGWLALTPPPPSGGTPSAVAEGPAPSLSKEAPPRAVPRPLALADAQVNEYLLAHQEYSPTTAMQGVASYVRTVPNEDPDSSR